jgi:hypothetical protein
VSQHRGRNRSVSEEVVFEAAAAAAATASQQEMDVARQCCALQGYSSLVSTITAIID